MPREVAFDDTQGVFQPKAESNARDRWFRSADWDDATRADFEARLASARPHNRSQYRRIKAVALLDTGQPDKESAGYRLLSEALTDADTPDFERATALSLLGFHDLDRGRLDDADRNLRSAIALLARGGSGGTQLEEVALAEVLLARGGRSELEEARALLESRAKDPPLLLKDRFRLSVTAARVSLALGEPGDASA